MKVNDPRMTPELRAELAERLRTHTEILRGIQIATADRAQRYLILTNAGGAVATLSFIGTKPELRENPVCWVVLGLFGAGVILCGILMAINYHTSSRQLLVWIANVNRYSIGEIGFGEVFGALTRNIQRTRLLAPMAGWLAFITFIAGCATALATLRPHSPASDPPAITRLAPLA